MVQEITTIKEKVHNKIISQHKIQKLQARQIRAAATEPARLRYRQTGPAACVAQRADLAAWLSVGF